MASFDKTVLFFSIITSNRRITIKHLAARMECTRRHVYRMVNTASRHMPIRLENGVVIYDRTQAGEC